MHIHIFKPSQDYFLKHFYMKESLLNLMIFALRSFRMWLLILNAEFLWCFLPTKQKHKIWMWRKRECLKPGLCLLHRSTASLSGSSASLLMWIWESCVAALSSVTSAVCTNHNNPTRMKLLRRLTLEQLTRNQHKPPLHNRWVETLHVCERQKCTININEIIWSGDDSFLYLIHI